MHFISLFMFLVLSGLVHFSTQQNEEEYGNHYYVYYPSKITWNEAKDHCREQPGGNLVSLETREEMEFVNSFIDRVDNSGSEIAIGLRAEDCSTKPCSRFEWLSQPDVNPAFFEWDSGFPRNGTRPYALIRKANKKWINGVSTFLLNYICEYPGCAPGYTGEHCEPYIEECASDPCRHGLCKDGINSYSCNCAAGFTGVNCETNIDECASDPCMHTGTCVDQIHSYQCMCTQWYTGVHCESVHYDCNQYAPVDVCQAWLSKSLTIPDESDCPFPIMFVITLIVLSVICAILIGWNIRNYFKIKKINDTKDLYTKPNSKTQNVYSDIKAITMETKPDTDEYQQVVYVSMAAK